MRITATMALFVMSEAAKCKTRCDQPKILDDERCVCECPSSCESYQVQNTETCVCVDNPCVPCEPNQGGTATLGDFKQGPQPDCTCLPIEGNSACDFIYGGKWDKDLEGNACPDPSELEEEEAR